MTRWTSVLVLAALVTAAPAAAQEPPPASPGAASHGPDRVVLVRRSPVGKQFLIFGLELSGWLGSGTLYELEQGGRGPKVGTYLDSAVGIGPVSVGFNHVVSRHLHFELRLGLGAVVFPNDRLLSRDLDGRGDLHVGLLYGAELLGRYVTDPGLTFSVGGNLSGVSLPDDAGALLRISPRVGYLMWEKGYAGFGLVELGYQFPLINGLEPEFEGVVRDPPVDSVWHVVTLSYLWAF